MTTKDELIQVYRTALAATRKVARLEEELSEARSEIRSWRKMERQTRVELEEVHKDLERAHDANAELRVQLDEEHEGALEDQKWQSELLQNVSETHAWLEVAEMLVGMREMEVVGSLARRPIPGRCLSCGGDKGPNTWICLKCCAAARDYGWGPMSKLVDQWNAGARDFPRAKV